MSEAVDEDGGAADVAVAAAHELKVVAVDGVAGVEAAGEGDDGLAGGGREAVVRFLRWRG